MITYLKASTASTIGCGPPSTFQPNSAPGARPGRTLTLVDGCLAPAYMRVADSTCAADRHAESSCPEPEAEPEHCSTLGSKEHAPGFSSTPSATPSFASHAASTAW